MSASHSDHGTVLKPDQAAIIWSADEGFGLVMPDYPEDAEVPEQIVALAALLTKLDRDFLLHLVKDFSADRN